MKKTLVKKPKYLTPLDIPAGRSGDFEIVRKIEPAGSPMMLNSIRTAMYGQKGPSKVVYEQETVWHGTCLVNK